MSARELGVVGIGASAGGISALQLMFEALGADGAPHAFVVVQHSSADQPSQLVRLLRAWTPLAVHEAADEVVVAPGCVYVAPPGRALVVAAGAFQTFPLDRASPHTALATVDVCLESLAVEYGARAIGVVLSGSGSDGAAGAVCIRREGGLVLVQDPLTAMHASMPEAAIASGAADHVLAPAALARELAATAAPGYARAASAPQWAEDVARAFAGMVELVRARAGIDLASYKATPLLWRVQRRMQLRRVLRFADYEALLHDDASELETLVRGLPIHVTGFFRDPEVWDLLERDVIPALFADAAGTVRAWTPACATGEEAYSLAMLLAEHAGDRGFQVFATDASTDIVARASRGVFAAAAAHTLSDARRAAHLYAADGAYRVKRTLREKLVFAPQDLLVDPPIGGIDLVTCRNVLIYLAPEAARHVLELVHAALRVGGWLVLGRSESPPAGFAGLVELAPGSHI